MMKSELIFIPLPTAGHLASAMQMAKLLVNGDDSLSIRILVFKDVAASSSEIKSLYAETTEGIHFTEFPEPQPKAYSSVKSQNPFIFLCKIMETYKPQVRDFVSHLKNSGSSKLLGFVVDMFTLEMIDIAHEFELPSYLFYAASVSSLGLWLILPSLEDDNIDITLYRESKDEFSVSTYKIPVPAKLFPSVVFDREGLEVCLKLSRRIIQTKGIIVNSFQELEPYALKALINDQDIPPVSTIGPLINFSGIDTNRPETDTITRWLDDQPESSVVFLCFGSLGYFDVGDQVKEIANALENSGCRFLWSLRRPPSDQKQYPASDCEFQEEVLPEGFLRRTSGIGKIIGWAPQVEVLGHPAVGGFVTHCGWNSVLESVWFGVPMGAWPMYSEQQANALMMVKDVGIALEIKMDYNIDPMMMSSRVIVKADEIENGIREVMQTESEIRKNVKELMGKARSAMLKGGSSCISMGNLMDDILTGGN